MPQQHLFLLYRLLIQKDQVELSASSSISVSAPATKLNKIVFDEDDDGNESNSSKSVGKNETIKNNEDDNDNDADWEDETNETINKSIGVDSNRDDEDDDKDEDSDAPVEVSLSDAKSAARLEKLKTIEALKSKKLEAKATHEQRATKGRELNLEKKRKAEILVAAKNAKDAIEMSVFEEAEKEAVKIFEENDIDDPHILRKKKLAKNSVAKKISGFTVIPLDAALAKQKPVAQSVNMFSATIAMTQTRDGPPPNFVRKVR
ncbi:hypothetical protein HK100_008170 [Physocladia obscura]|uniref:Uncharacterized protein n=1 Tax=Physocladia obscura TaxID=109957 RepID=A0AAD5T4F0_9FUNG|nr:hypothetical protein HK100_008170 [Physocladia obscura]